MCIFLLTSLPAPPSVFYSISSLECPKGTSDASPPGLLVSSPGPVLPALIQFLPRLSQQTPSAQVHKPLKPGTSLDPSLCLTPAPATPARKLTLHASLSQTSSLPLEHTGGSRSPVATLPCLHQVPQQWWQVASSF